MIRKIRYYLQSLIVLFQEVQKPFKLIFWFTKKKPYKLVLKNSIIFYIQNLIDLLILKETLFDDCYKIDQNEFEPKIVIDIGAAFGDYSVYMAKKNPHSTVYAFEPGTDSFSLLEQNIKMNKLKNIVPINKAVASYTGKISFSTHSLAVQHSTTHISSSDERVKKVDCISLEDFFIQERIEMCDILKLDCEGGEFDILLHLHPHVFSKINALVFEYHDSFTTHSHDELTRLLRKIGYQVRTQVNGIHSNIGIIKATKTQ